MPQASLATRYTVVWWTLALVFASLLVVPLRVAHDGYLALALALGGFFFVRPQAGFRERGRIRWSKSLFVTSIVYIVLLFAALALDP
jgi:protoheme IX farnesyltransferase